MGGGGHKPPGTVPSFLIQEAKRVQTRGPNTEPPAGAQTDSLVSAASDGGDGDSTGSPCGGHRDGWGGGCTPGTGVGAPKLPRVLLSQVPKEEGAGPPRILPTTVAPRMPSVSTAPRGGCSAVGRGVTAVPGDPPVSMGLHPPGTGRGDLGAAVPLPLAARGNGTAGRAPRSPHPHCVPISLPPPLVSPAPLGGPERAPLRGHERHPRRRPAVLPAVAGGWAFWHFSGFPLGPHTGPGLHRQEDGQGPPRGQPEGRCPRPHHGALPPPQNPEAVQGTSVGASPWVKGASDFGVFTQKGEKYVQRGGRQQGWRQDFGEGPGVGGVSGTVPLPLHAGFGEAERSHKQFVTDVRRGRGASGSQEGPPPKTLVVPPPS